MILVDMVVIVVEIYRMARFASCTQDFGIRLWRHESSVVAQAYKYALLHIVDNAGRNATNFGRKGLIINDLSFFRY